MRLGNTVVKTRHGYFAILVYFFLLRFNLSIFYIGINIGAFLSSLIVGYVGEVYGWHYGFGLAAIGMALGLIQYLVGQKHLKYVGNNTNKSIDPEEKAAMKRPLSKVEKDRMIVLFIRTN